MTARQKAGDLLVHYISHAWEAAGLEFTGDNMLEVRSIADALADAAREGIRAELDALIRDYRALNALVATLAPASAQYPAGPDQVRGDGWYEAEGLDPGEDPEQGTCDPGPECDDEGGMSEYRPVPFWGGEPC
jgi:hypothetical protein